MKAFLLHILVFMSSASATWIPRTASAPFVTIDNGTVIGQSNGKVDNFLGIPYAQPPTGPLRLKPPQSIAKQYGTILLPTVATACTQQNQSGIDLTGIPDEAKDILTDFEANATFAQSEDCLTISVQRPAGTPSNAKLPVLFWIYGGGLESGATVMYDGEILVEQSINMTIPMVYVAVNYRLGAFGFLPGKQLMEDGSTNLGLRDQRLGLQWVAENIAAFGGDPDRVTIMGESAGAISVFDHLLIDHGDNTYKGKPLFHGAIMDSGSIFRTLPVNSSKAQAVFDNVAAHAGCGPEKSSDPLECLRTVPYETFIAAQEAQPNFLGYMSNDLAFNIRPDASNSFLPLSPEIPAARGEFANVPVIMSNQEDEGTIFAIGQRNLTTTEALIDYFAAWYTDTSKEIVSGLVDTYPDDAAAGAPFGTGAANELYPQFKRNAAIQTDLTFLMTRRQALSNLACRVPTWTYLATYRQEVPLLGTYHISDLSEVFAHAPIAAPGETIDSYYINFVHSLNPNGAGLKHWPTWDETGLQMLNISATDVTYIKDDFRWASYEYYKSHLDYFHA